VSGPKRRRTRQRGTIDELPSGALRVRVYSGVDPISKRRMYLTGVVPAGPKAREQAEKVRTRLLHQVDEKRNPRTRATVGQLLDRSLQVLDVDPSTRRTYDGYIRKHIRPVLGSLPLTRLDVKSWTPFMRSCGDAGSTAMAGHTCNTGPVGRIDATSTRVRRACHPTLLDAMCVGVPANRTCAAALRTRLSGRFIGFSVAPLTGQWCGSGSRSSRPRTPANHHCRIPTPGRWRSPAGSDRASRG